MDYINVNENGVKFNWDDIQVGNHILNHSENFFDQKNIIKETNEMDELDEVNQASAGIDDKLIGLKKQSEDKENDNPILSGVQILQNETKFVAPPSPKQERSSSHLEVTKICSKPPPNIACQWSTQKIPISETVIGNAKSTFIQPVPRAYLIKDVYQRKKEEALRKQMEDERKMREFHSRPAPKFNAKLKKLDKHAVTVPVTPKVLKNSFQANENRKKKLEQLKHQNIESDPPNVLKEEPFVPKKSAVLAQPRPFQLKSGQRALERKLFDKATQQAHENKRIQEADQRKKNEEDRIKELRRMAAFKARPNPFK